MQRIYSLVWKQFTQRKLRSSLTIIGILIGISALISLVLLSAALKQGVTGQLDRFEADTILIAPKAALAGGPPSGIGEFTEDDVETLEGIPQLLEVNPMVNADLEIKAGRDTVRTNVIGYELGKYTRTFEDFIQKDIRAGRYLDAGDSGVAMVGSKVATDLFDKELFVGNAIRIEGKKFTVIGIFEVEGDQRTDFQISVPIEDIRDTLGAPKAVTGIMTRVAPGVELDVMSERIIKVLERKRGEEDFSVITPQQIKDEITGFLVAVDFVVLSIAFVSLFVAALGIMNSLYTSVLQRTKEIGTMKAVGARNRQILLIFVLESAILGLAGGILGILFGIFLASIFIAVLNTFGFVRMDLALDLNLMIGALLFSVLLGIISGFLPAYRASKLKPVDALRYE